MSLSSPSKNRDKHHKSSHHERDRGKSDSKSHNKSSDKKHSSDKSHKRSRDDSRDHDRTPKKAKSVLHHYDLHSIMYLIVFRSRLNFFIQYDSIVAESKYIRLYHKVVKLKID